MRNTASSSKQKLDKFDTFDAPKYYCFRSNKQKINPRQTSINRQSQLDRWFTVLHVEQPTAIKKIKLEQQQQKISKNSKDQKKSLSLKNVRKIMANQNRPYNIKDQITKSQDLQQPDQKIKEKESLGNIDQRLQKYEKKIKYSNYNLNPNIKQKTSKSIKIYEQSKPIKLSRPKLQIQNQDKQRVKKTSKLSENNLNKTNLMKASKQQSKNVSAPKHITVSQAVSSNYNLRGKGYQIKPNGPSPCPYAMRIQRQWQNKNNKKWYSLSQQSKKRAEKSMQKMRKQTKPKIQQKNLIKNKRIGKISKKNIFTNDKPSKIQQLEL